MFGVPVSRQRLLTDDGEEMGDAEKIWDKQYMHDRSRAARFGDYGPGDEDLL